MPTRRDGCSRVLLSRELVRKARRGAWLLHVAALSQGRARALACDPPRTPCRPPPTTCSTDPMLSADPGPSAPRGRPAGGTRAQGVTWVPVAAFLFPIPIMLLVPLRQFVLPRVRPGAAQLRVGSEAALLCKADLMFEAASRPAERHVQAHLGRSGHPPLGAPRANRTSELHLERSGVQSRHAEAHQAGSVRPPKPSQTLLRRWRRAGVAAARAARAGRGGVRGGAAAAARARRPGARPPQRGPRPAAQRRCWRAARHAVFLHTALPSAPALPAASQSPLARFAFSMVCVWCWPGPSLEAGP